MLVFLILVVVMSANISCVFGQNCLTNLRVNNIAATSMSVEWKYLDNQQCSIQNIKEFKIYYKHEGYIACEGGSQDTMERVIAVRQTETVSLVGLEPFSRYSIEVKALLSTKGRGKKVRRRPEVLTLGSIKTEKALPEVKLRLPKDSVFKSNSSLTFTWNEPSDCQAFHSHLGGYYYQFKQEGHREMAVGNLSLKQPSVKFSNLEPFTNYKLYVYITDEVGAYDHNNGLVFTASTDPSPPPPPTKLQVSAQNGAYIVSWLPPTIPKGNIDKYHLQLQMEQRPNWTLSEYIQPPWNKGPNGEIIHILNIHISNNSNYTFRIQAFNERVSQPSLWSNPASYSTISFNSSSTGTTIGIILILFFIIIFSIFLVVFIWRKRHRLSSFRLVPTHETFVKSNPSASPCSKANGGKQKDEDYEAPILRTKQNTYVTEPHQATNKNIYVDMEKPHQESTDRSSRGSSVEKSVRRRSCLDPLPAVPGQHDPVYYNIRDNVSSIRDNNVSEHPNPGLDKGVEKTYELGSVESLDSEGYLKPNFKH